MEKASESVCSEVFSILAAMRNPRSLHVGGLGADDGDLVRDGGD